MANSPEILAMYLPPNQGAREKKSMLSETSVIAFNTNVCPSIFTCHDSIELSRTANCSAIGSTSNHLIILDRPLVGLVLRAHFNMCSEVLKNRSKMRE